MLLASMCRVIGSLSTRVFETRTATGNEPFSLSLCLHATTFILLSIFPPLEMISIKILETSLSWHAKCCLPVAVLVSKTPVLKLPNYLGTTKTRLALYYWYIVVGVWRHFPVVIKGLLTFGAGFLSSSQILAVLILGARGSIRDDAIFSGEDISVRKFTSRAFFRKYLPLRISPRVECYPWVSDDAPYCIVNHQRSPLQITINQWKENKGSEISKILRHLSFTIFAGFENDFLSLPVHIPIIVPWTFLYLLVFSKHVSHAISLLLPTCLNQLFL